MLNSLFDSVCKSTTFLTDSQGNRVHFVNLNFITLDFKGLQKQCKIQMLHLTK